MLLTLQADLGKGSMQFAGTAVYMAPELFQKRTYDETVDVFAFGTMLWEIMTREVPFDGLDPADIRAAVEKGEQLRLPFGLDPRLGQLINECRATNSTHRPAFTKIAQVLQGFN